MNDSLTWDGTDTCMLYWFDSELSLNFLTKSLVFGLSLFSLIKLLSKIYIVSSWLSISKSERVNNGISFFLLPYVSVTPFL